MISTCEPLSWVLTKLSSALCLLSIVLDLVINGYRLDLCALSLCSNIFRCLKFYWNYFYKMLIFFKYINKYFKSSFSRKKNLKFFLTKTN